MRFVLSFSGGKDSVLAMDRMVRMGHAPVALLSMYRPSAQRTWTHGLDDALLNAVAEAMGLPLIRCKAEGEDYAEVMEAGLREARALGAEGCVFGDIDIEAHRSWDLARCAAAGLEPLLPLWNCGREAAVREVMDRGYRCLIKCVRRGVLPPELLGQALSPELLGEIGRHGADLCGENGEYHTLVVDGPVFQHPVGIVNRGVVELEHIYAADLTLLN